MGLVLLSLITLSCLLLILFIYYNVWPKKKIPGIILVILFSIPPLLSVLRPGTYESGDLSIHVAGTLSFYNSLVDGSLIPRWAGDMINGYGTPHHQIMYFLPRYIPSLFHLLGIPMLISIKIFIITTYIASGIGMYLFSKKEYGEIPAIVGSIFYLYAPYHLIDMHFRVSIGELMAFALVPFCFYYTSQLIDKPKYKNFLLTIVTIASLILSHVAIATLTIPFILMYALFTKISFVNFKNVLISIISSVLLSAFYLLPILLENQFMFYSTYKDLAFYPITELLFSPYRYGLLFQGPTGDLALIIGYVQLAIIFTAITFIILKRDYSQKFLFYLLSTLFLVFLITPQSRFIWNTIPVLRGFEFTYRILLFVSFFNSLLAAWIAFKVIKTKKVFNKLLVNFRIKTLIILMIILLGILQTILNWGNRRNIPTIFSDEYYEKVIPTYLLDNNGTDYATPIWVNTKMGYYREKRPQNIQIVTGSADIKELERSNTYHKYILSVYENSKIRENTFYFPEWKLLINGKNTLMNYEEKDYPGIIHFNLSKGLYLVELKYEESDLRWFANFLSISILIILVAGLIFNYKHGFQRSK